MKIEQFLQRGSNLLKNLGHGQLVRNDQDGAVIEHEVSSIDACLAILSDAHKPEIRRVEVRMGEKFYGKTEEFRRRADQQARAFVRDGSTSYALSISKADLLDDQSHIYVQIFKRQHSHQATGGKVTPPVDKREVQIALIKEIAYASMLARKNHAQSCVSGITVICRDPGTDALLQVWHNDKESWNDTFRRVLEKNGVTSTPVFNADYRFEKHAPRTAEVGEGTLLIELHSASANQKQPGTTSPPIERNDWPSTNAVGTFDIGEDVSLSALVTWSGIGTDVIPGETPVSMALPGIIDRSLLARTSLTQFSPGLLQVASGSTPLRCGVEHGYLTLEAQQKRSRTGNERPIYFLVQKDGSEIPIVGKQRVESGNVTVLVGGPSHVVGRSPDGKEIRPIRINISLAGR